VSSILQKYMKKEGVRMGGIEADTFLLFGMVLALGAGALSFLSPCVLPIFPAYLSYITGMGVKEIQGERTGQIRRTLLSHSFFFVLGVVVVFISLGVVESLLGMLLQQLLRGDSGLFIPRIAGIFIIVTALFVAGWLKIKFLMKEKRLQYKKANVSY